ncbi:MAG: MFS transporter, partial [Chloroflexota bacterium]|nr:MFS transporter [Chloroflexota bacterium]
AGLWVGIYWGSLASGRLFFGAVVERVGTTRLLRISLLGALLGALLLAMRIAPVISFVGLSLVGLSLAPVFPSLMSQTPGRVGARLASHAVGFQVSAAVLGGATIPSVTGIAVQQVTLEVVGMVLVALALSLTLLHEGLLVLVRRREGDRLTAG